MTTPSIRSVTSSSENVDVTSHDVSYPATISSGDLLVAFLTVDTSTVDVAFPSGWLPIYTVGSGISLHCAVKVATGSETGTFTVTTDVAEASAHIVYSVYDWSGDVGDISWSGIRAATATTKDPPEVLTGLASHDWLFIAAAGVDSSVTFSAFPTDYSLSQTQQNGNVTIGAAGRQVSATTSADPGTFTHGGSDDGAAFTLAIPGPNPVNPFPKIKATRFDTEPTNTTAPIVNFPADIASGDLILFALACDGQPTVTVPTTLGTFTLIDSHSNGTATTIEVYGKVATGSEASNNITLTTTSEQFNIGVWIISDWSGSLADITDANSFAASNANSAGPDPGSVTPDWGADDTLWAFFGSMDGGAGQMSAWSTGYYNQSTVLGGATGATLFSAFSRQNTATVDPSALTSTVADDWAIIHLAIKPAPAADTTFSAVASTGIQNWLGFQPTQLGIHRNIQPGIAYLNAEGFVPGVNAGRYVEPSTGYVNVSGFSAQAIYDSIATAGRINFNTGTHQTHVTREFFGLLGQLRALGFLVDQTNSQGFFPNLGSIAFQGPTGATVTIFAPPTTFTAAALLRETHFVGFQAQTIREFFPISANTHALGFTPQYVEFIKEITGPDQGEVNFSGFQAQAIILGQINDAIAQRGQFNLVGFQHAVDMWRTLDSLQGRINMQGFAAGVALFQGGTINLSGVTGEINFDTLQQAIGMYRTFYPDSGLTNAEGYVPVPSTGTLVQSIVGILNQEGFVPFIVAERYRGIVGEMRLEGFAPTIGGGLWTPKRRRATSWAAIN